MPRDGVLAGPTSSLIARQHDRAMLRKRDWRFSKIPGSQAFGRTGEFREFDHFSRSQSKREVGRKSFEVTFDSLIQRPGGHTIKLSQIDVEQNSSVTGNQDRPDNVPASG
jgi:hypothetical protein